MNIKKKGYPISHDLTKVMQGQSGNLHNNGNKLVTKLIQQRG